MERSIAATLAPVLEGNDDALPIPDYGKGEDPYQGYQVHDYGTLTKAASQSFFPLLVKEN
jgi:hypothetical protein